jgi:hypothetical protein
MEGWEAARAFDKAPATAQAGGATSLCHRTARRLARRVLARRQGGGLPPIQCVGMVEKCKVWTHLTG